MCVVELRFPVPWRCPCPQSPRWCPLLSCSLCHPHPLCPHLPTSPVIITPVIAHHMVCTEMGLKMRVCPPDVTLKPLHITGTRVGQGGHSNLSKPLPVPKFRPTLTRRRRGTPECRSRGAAPCPGCSGWPWGRQRSGGAGVPSGSPCTPLTPRGRNPLPAAPSPPRLPSPPAAPPAGTAPAGAEPTPAAPPAGKEGIGGGICPFPMLPVTGEEHQDCTTPPPCGRGFSWTVSPKCKLGEEETDKGLFYP